MFPSSNSMKQKNKHYGCTSTMDIMRHSGIPTPKNRRTSIYYGKFAKKHNFHI